MCCEFGPQSYQPLPPSPTPTPPLNTQEYLNDYGDDEARKLGQALIAKESEAGLSDSAKRLLGRKMAKVNAGEHDVYI